MSFYYLSLFPNEVRQYFLKGIFKRAFDKNLFNINFIDLRDFGIGDHKKVDHYPFSEKKGMVLRVDSLYNAITSIADYQNMRIIYTCPKGQLFDQVYSKEIIQENKSLILIPGYYEGIDERIFEVLPIERVSIGNYILNSGDTAALAIAETIIRQIPGVLGNEGCIEDDSLYNNELESPQYTQPLEFKGHKVPDILRSGHHALVADWKKEQALNQTLFMRPDILAKKEISNAEKEVLTKILNKMVVKEND
jgi:tRNA (guanine37-N1)-methyltransferase